MCVLARRNRSAPVAYVSPRTQSAKGTQSHNLSGRFRIQDPAVVVEI